MCVLCELHSFHWCPQLGSVIKPSVAWRLLFFGCRAKPQPGPAERTIPQARWERTQPESRVTEYSSSPCQPFRVQRLVTSFGVQCGTFVPSEGSAVHIWSSENTDLTSSPTDEKYTWRRVRGRLNWGGKRISNNKHLDRSTAWLCRW